KKAVNDNDNPYGKTNLEQETIDQLDDPLYQNQITPDDLDEKLDNQEDLTVRSEEHTSELQSRFDIVCRLLLEKKKKIKKKKKTQDKKKKQKKIETSIASREHKKSKGREL